VLRQRLTTSEREIEAADTQFSNALANGQAGYLKGSDFGLTEVSATEMSWLYKNKMVDPRGPARHVYDELRLAPRHGVCPLCGHRRVMTLDHFLPKSSYSALAVNPLNLVPSCSDCNKIKSSSVMDGIHPYFDNIESERWLYAEVVELTPPGLRFHLRKPVGWPLDLERRLKSHFETFGLGPLYAAQAARMMGNIKMQLSEISKATGSDGVQKHLQQCARSARTSKLNSWETALFEALYESEWFCGEGFRLI